MLADVASYFSDPTPSGLGPWTLGREHFTTREELAHRLGMDVSYLNELENGKKEPCLRKMKELAQGLGVPLS